MASLKETIDSSLVRELGSRHISRKLEVLDYMVSLIDWITLNKKLNKATTYNFNHFSDHQADVLKISRKEKEIVRDLVDHYFPLPKLNLNDMGNRLKKQMSKRSGESPPLSPDKNGNTFMKGGQVAVSGGELIEGKMLLVDQGKVDPKKDNLDGDEKSLENLLKKAKKKIPEIKFLHKSYDGDAPKFIATLHHLNGLNVSISQATSRAELEKKININLIDLIQLPKLTNQFIDMKFKLNPSGISICNIGVESQVLYRAITTFEHYDTITVRSLHEVRRAGQHSHTAFFVAALF